MYYVSYKVLCMYQLSIFKAVVSESIITLQACNNMPVQQSERMYNYSSFHNPNMIVTREQLIPYITRPRQMFFAESETLAFAVYSIRMLEYFIKEFIITTYPYKGVTTLYQFLV